MPQRPQRRTKIQWLVDAHDTSQHDAHARAGGFSLVLPATGEHAIRDNIVGAPMPAFAGYWKPSNLTSLASLGEVT